VGPCHQGMARLQLAGGGDNIQLCRVARIGGKIRCTLGTGTEALYRLYGP